MTIVVIAKSFKESSYTRRYNETLTCVNVKYLLTFWFGNSSIKAQYASTLVTLSFVHSVTTNTI